MRPPQGRAGTTLINVRWTWTLVKGWQLPVVIVAWGAAVVATLLGPKLVQLPDLSGLGQVPAPFASLAGGVCAVVAVSSATEPCPAVFVTAPHRARIVNLTRVTLAGFLGPCLIAGLGTSDWSATASTTLALVGEGLVAASVLGLSLAWLFPMLHLLAAGTAGAATRDSLHLWAWVLAAHPGAEEWTLSLTVLTAGLLLWARAMGRTPARLEL